MKLDLYSETAIPTAALAAVYEVAALLDMKLKVNVLTPETVSWKPTQYPIMVLGKPSLEMVQASLREHDPLQLVAGPSIKQILNTAAGLERLRRALRLWVLTIDGETVDDNYQYDLIFPGKGLAGNTNTFQNAASCTAVIVDIEVSGNVKEDEPEDTELISVAINFVHPVFENGYRILVWTQAALADDECCKWLAYVLTHAKTLVGHNLQFDFKWLNNLLRGWLGTANLYPHRDTMLNHYTLFPGDENGGHGLKELAQKLLGAPEWEHGIAKYTVKGAHYENIPEYLLYSYNAADVYYDWKLDQLLLEWLDEGCEGPRQLIRNLIIPATQMFVDVESTEAGWPLDIDHAQMLQIEYTERCRVGLIKFKKTVGDPAQYLSEANAKQRAAWIFKGIPLRSTHEFNPGSWQQVKKWLELHGSFLENTQADTLLKHTKYGTPTPKVAKFITRLVAYRHDSKMLSTYITGVLNSERGGRVRPKYRLAGTTTGRLAATRPAIQTIPRKESGPLREMFTVEEGEILVGIDYGQMETRCVAELCGDAQMIDDLQLDRGDFFDILVPQVFSRQFSSYKAAMKFKAADPGTFKMLRGRIKPISHGVNYGRGAKAIAIAEEMPVDEAYRIRDVYLNRYPLLVDWQNETMEYVYGKKMDPTWGVPGLWTPFGRRFQQGVITSRTENNIKNAALAFRPQSIGSDICVSAAIDLHNNYLPKMEARLVGFVHDALYAITKIENGEEVKAIMSERMTHSALQVFHDVPFPVDAKLGYNWQEVS